ncbi:MAG TPA: phosphotransferase [Alphaproteobacteria bacterium]|nr:phosphotransferase [Alphaproteobacteria bacterium]
MSDSEFVGTTPVRAGHGFDVGALERYLKANVDGFKGKLEVEQFKGGQSNPTFLLKLDGISRYVLRKKPAGPLLPSAHAVDREYRVMKALAGTDVPVAPMILLCEDPEIIGTAFFVMGFVEGRSFWDPRLPDLTNAQRASIYAELNRVIAALHKVDYAAVGLDDYGKPGNFFVRQIGRWTKQYRASETGRIEAMESLIAWLPENIPPGDETALVHGDYRLDNTLFHPTEPRILAVVDWELSTLGHPLADFAYHVMVWRFRPEEFRGLAGVDLDALGIPNESQYIRSYCERTGRDLIDPADWDFYLAYNMFRLACIRQGILKRALEGNASSQQAEEVGRRAGETAMSAWRIVENMANKKRAEI